MIALRIAAAIAFVSLLTIIGCDAFAMARADDRRADVRHQQVHPFVNDDSDSWPMVTGPYSTGVQMR